MINYDLVKQDQNVNNWIQNLLEYSKCLNKDKSKELGWSPAFEVYYRRKSNKLVKCDVSVNREKEFNVQKVIQPSENLIYEREKAKKANRKSVIGQLNTTGREGSARNIRKEKKCLSGMERKTGKKRQKTTNTTLKEESNNIKKAF